MTEDDYRRLPDDRLIDCYWHICDVLRHEKMVGRIHLDIGIDRPQVVLWQAKRNIIRSILVERGIPS